MTQSKSLTHTIFLKLLSIAHNVKDSAPFFADRDLRINSVIPRFRHITSLLWVLKMLFASITGVRTLVDLLLCLVPFDKRIYKLTTLGIESFGNLGKSVIDFGPAGDEGGHRNG